MAFTPTFASMLILDFLKRNNYNKIMQSVSLRELIDGINGEDPSGNPVITDSTARKAVDTLYWNNFVNLGIKIGNSFTYYVTAEGLKYLEFATTGKQSK